MISSVPLFSGLKKKQLQEIANAGKELSYQPGDKIVQEGENGVGFYLVLEGKVEVRRRGKVLSSMNSGQFFGEMSLLDDRPRSADVVALEPTRCFGFTPWSFSSLVHTNPEMSFNMMKELVRRLRSTNKALTE
jgi:CRP/FNR family cyclic AMP-dependent transcriptional regulator